MSIPTMFPSSSKSATTPSTTMRESTLGLGFNSIFQKLLHLNACFTKDCAEGSFRKITAVMRDGHLATSGDVTPDFVAAGTLAVEGKAECCAVAARPPGS